MTRNTKRVCRHCEAIEASRTRAGVLWLVRCCKCGYWVCPSHVRFHKVPGLKIPAYRFECVGRCILRKRKIEAPTGAEFCERCGRLPCMCPRQITAGSEKTGLDEWEVFHPDVKPMTTREVYDSVTRKP